MSRTRKVTEALLDPGEVRRVRKQFARGCSFKLMEHTSGASRSTLKKAIKGLSPYDGIPFDDPWQDGLRKPEARRVYERKAGPNIFFSFWDGQDWRSDRGSATLARTTKSKSSLQNLPWRRI